MSERIAIQINGERREISAGLSLPGLIENLGLPAQSVLIEHNGMALFRTEWPQITLAENDRLEIIRIVAGG